MLIIFDVDGTLIGGEAYDWANFDGALENETGLAPTDAFFDSLPDITAHAIVEAELGQRTQEERRRAEDAVRQDYLNRLKAAHRDNPEAFRPHAGDQELLDELRAIEGMGVAIATGDCEIDYTSHC